MGTTTRLKRCMWKAHSLDLELESVSTKYNNTVVDTEKRKFIACCIGNTSCLIGKNLELEQSLFLPITHGRTGMGLRPNLHGEYRESAALLLDKVKESREEARQI